MCFLDRRFFVLMLQMRVIRFGISYRFNSHEKFCGGPLVGLLEALDFAKLHGNHLCCGFVIGVLILALCRGDLDLF